MSDISVGFECGGSGASVVVQGVPDVLGESDGDVVDLVPVVHHSVRVVCVLVKCFVLLIRGAGIYYARKNSIGNISCNLFKKS